MNFKRIISCCLTICVLLTFSGCSTYDNRQSRTFVSYFDTVITVIGYDSTDNFKTVCNNVETELKRYHNLFDIYKKYDGINNLCTINENAGTPVKVEEELIKFLNYCKDMHTLTGGKTNIALGSVLSLWHNSRLNKVLPEQNTLEEASKHTDINNLQINKNDNTVCILDSKMRLDVGAIAKGYALVKICEKLEEKGISNYAINAGGMVRCIGTRGDESEWTVGIENPNDNSKLIATVEPRNYSLVTSGTYQRYFELDGKRYHHIIDPDTLYPQNNYLSVSVLTENAALGDALSTALFNMTIEQGKELIENLEGKTYVLWVKPDQSVIYSDGFKDFIKE